jgi:hypothetical protein
MNFNALLDQEKIEQRNVLVMRHRPHEPQLRKVLPWLAAEKPDVFNAYQQTQGEKVEKARRPQSMSRPLSGTNLPRRCLSASIRSATSGRLPTRNTGKFPPTTK